MQSVVKVCIVAEQYGHGFIDMQTTPIHFLSKTSSFSFFVCSWPPLSHFCFWLFCLIWQFQKEIILMMKIVVNALPFQKILSVWIWISLHPELWLSLATSFRMICMKVLSISICFSVFKRRACSYFLLQIWHDVDQYMAHAQRRICLSSIKSRPDLILVILSTMFSFFFWSSPFQDQWETTP